MAKNRRNWCASAALLTLFLASGCSDRITASDIRRDMTPELQSMAMDKEQRKNRHARTFDTSLRQVWDDLDAILLLDRPSRMTRYPVP